MNSINNSSFITIREYLSIDQIRDKVKEGWKMIHYELTSKNYIYVFKKNI